MSNTHYSASRPTTGRGISHQITIGFWKTVPEETILKHYSTLSNVTSLPPILCHQFPLFGREPNVVLPSPGEEPDGAGEESVSLLALTM